MKFNPEILLKLYLEGSLTPEARAEFDLLMRRDPLYSEKVTAALAGKLGPLPDAQVEEIQSRLAPKMAEVWRSARPVPWNLYFHLGWKILLALAALTAMGWGFFSLLSSKNGNATEKLAEEDHLSLVILQDAPVKKHPKKKFLSSDMPSAPSLAVSNPSGQMVEEVRPPVLSQGGSATTEEGTLVRLSVNMEKTQEVQIEVLDSAGKTVRNLYQGSWNQGEHTLDWDGKDNRGLSAPPGTYLVTILSDGKTQSASVNLHSAQ